MTTNCDGARSRSSPQPNNFDEILQEKAKLGKYSKEKWYSEHNQQLPFKHFVESYLISKLSSNES